MLLPNVFSIKFIVNTRLGVSLSFHQVENPDDFVLGIVVVAVARIEEMLLWEDDDIISPCHTIVLVMHDVLGHFHDDEDIELIRVNTADLNFLPLGSPQRFADVLAELATAILVPFETTWWRSGTR